MVELAVVKYTKEVNGKKVDVYGSPGIIDIAPKGSNIQVPHSTATLRAGGFVTSDNNRAKDTSIRNIVELGNEIISKQTAQNQLSTGQSIFRPSISQQYARAGEGIISPFTALATKRVQEINAADMRLRIPVDAPSTISSYNIENQLSKGMYKLESLRQSKQLESIGGGERAFEAGATAFGASAIIGGVKALPYLVPYYGEIKAAYDVGTLFSKQGYAMYRGEYGPLAELGRGLELSPASTTGEIFGQSTILTKGGEIKGKAYDFYNVPKLKDILSRTYQEMPWVKKPQQYTPTGLVESGVLSRKTSRLFLKTETGEYVLGRTKGGTTISIGGGIEKGFTPTRTVKMELLEELGGFKSSQTKLMSTSELNLRIKKLGISEPKFISKIINPEETASIYTANIKTSDLFKLKPSSDISGGLYFLKPSRAKGFTGASPQYPISKGFLFEPGKVRSSELGIINFLETGTKPTWLVKTSPSIGFGKSNLKFSKLTDIFERRGELVSAQRSTSGRFQAFGDVFYIGTQSRYDVTKAVPKYLSVKRPQIFAHASPYQALKETRLFSERLSIKPAKRTESKTIGLYVQPPISAKAGVPGYIGSSYFNVFNKRSTKGLDLSTEISFTKPTAYLFKERYGQYIQPTQKAILGIESEANIPTGLSISTIGMPQKFMMGGKTIRLQPAEVVKSFGTIESFSPKITPTEIISRFPTELSSSFIKVNQKNLISEPSRLTYTNRVEPPPLLYMSRETRPKLDQGMKSIEPSMAKGYMTPVISHSTMLRTTGGRYPRLTESNVPKYSQIKYPIRYPKIMPPEYPKLSESRTRLYPPPKYPPIKIMKFPEISNIYRNRSNRVLNSLPKFKQFKVSSTPRYSPSLAAVFGKIYGKGKKKSTTSGLEFRPL